MWLGIRIGPLRKAANVPHPHVSTPPESIKHASSVEEARALYVFNCAQRAHYNTLENYSTVLSGMLISGFIYPRLSAAAGFLWIVGRIIYAFGYSSAKAENVNGSGRFANGGFHLAATSQVGLLVLVGKMGLDLLWA